MVFNVTFSNILVWRKPENTEKTTDLSQVTDKPKQIISCPRHMFERMNTYYTISISFVIVHSVKIATTYITRSIVGKRI